MAAYTLMTLPSRESGRHGAAQVRHRWRIIGAESEEGVAMRSIAVVLALLPCAVLPAAYAAGGVPPALSARLEVLAPGMKPDHVVESPLTGMYEVRYDSIIVYLSGDGRYMLQGDLIDLDGGRNVTEDARELVRADAVAALGASSMIVFSPRKTKHTITVFTDVDCPYCARMHQQMDEYNRLGIGIRYTAFPRAGVGSPTFDKMVSVWCAGDPHAAMTDAKAGRTIETATCDNPVREHYRTGRAIGVTGTPAIILESGQILPGYVPPEELAQRLDELGAG